MPWLSSLADTSARTLAVNQIEVRLACHRAPLFAFRLDAPGALRTWEGHFRDPQADNRAQLGFENGAEDELEVSLLGVARRSELGGFGRMSTADESINPFYVLATISGYPEFKKWFEGAPTMKGRLPAWLIYQLGGKEKPWDLIKRSLDTQAEQPGTADVLDPFLSEHGCLVRSAGWTNGQFLDHLTGLLASRHTGIRDWTLFNSNPAVRFVETSQAFSLDDNHWHLERQWVPGMLADAWWEGQPRRLETVFEPHENKIAAFFDRVTSFGFQNRVQELGDLVKESAQLVLLPGCVHYRDAALFVSAIRYSWDGGAKVEAVLELGDMHVRVGDRNANAAAIGPTPALLLEAAFQVWHNRENGEAYLEVVPLSDQDDRANSWKVVTDGKAEPLLLLAAMPGQTSQGVAKGCYVSHDAGDRMQILLVEGATPLSLGGLQTYDEVYEQASVSILGNIVQFPFQEELLMGDEVLRATHGQVDILSKVRFQ